MSDKVGWIDASLKALAHTQFRKLVTIVILLGLILLILPSAATDFLNITSIVVRYRGIITLIAGTALVALVVDLAFSAPRAFSSAWWTRKSEKQRRYEDTLASLELPQHYHALRVIQYCLYTKQPQLLLRRSSQTAYWLVSKGFLKRPLLSSRYRIPSWVWRRLREDEATILPQHQYGLEKLRRDAASFDHNFIP